MIESFITRFEANRASVISQLAEVDYITYSGLFEILVGAIAVAQVDDDAWELPDPARIAVVDHGDYQGTQVLVVGASGYQPRTYWATKVSYGSCSSCDSLKAALECEGEAKVSALFRLIMTQLQNLKEI